MNLGDALLGALGGSQAVYAPDEAVRALARVHGSMSAAARELGVPRSTMRGWAAGRRPRGSWAMNLAQLGAESDRELRMPPWREDEIRTAGPNIRVHGTFRYTGGGSMRGAEDRDLALGGWMDPGIGDTLADLYLNGADADELARAFHAAIHDGGFFETTFDPDNDRGYWDIDHLEGL